MKIGSFNVEDDKSDTEEEQVDKSKLPKWFRNI